MINYETYKFFALVENELIAHSLCNYIEKNKLISDEVLAFSASPNTYMILQEKGINTVRSSDFFDNRSHELAVIETDNQINCLQKRLTNILEPRFLDSGINSILYFYQWILSYVTFLEFSFDYLLKCSSDNSIFLIPDSNNINIQANRLSSEESFANEISQYKLSTKKVTYFPITKSSKNEIKKYSKCLMSLSLYFEKMAYLSLLSDSSNHYLLVPSHKAHLLNAANYQLGDLNLRKIYLRNLNQIDTSSNSEFLKKILFSILTIVDFFFKTKIVSFIFKSDINAILNIDNIACFHSFESKNLWDKNHIDWGKIGKYPLIREKCSNGILKAANIFSNRSHALESIIESSIIKAGFFIDSVGETSYIGEIFSKYKKLGFIISHGSHPLVQNPYARTQFQFHSKGLINTTYPFCAVQSPLTEDFLNSLQDFQSRKIITGPIIWGISYSGPSSLINNTFPVGKKILLHAGTQKSIHNLRFYLYETSDEYIDSLNDLIDQIEKLNDYFLIIKFRQSKDLSLSTLKKLLKKSECYKVVTENNFLDYLPYVDIVISFSSTTIEEAFENKIPVLLLSRNERYNFINEFPNSPIRVIHQLSSETNNLEESLNDLTNPNFNSDWSKLRFDKSLRKKLSSITP